MSSSGPETRYIRSIHQKLGKSVYSMKNHNPYVGGIADCWYSGDLADLWVEYKFMELPKRDSTVVDFRDTTKRYCLSKLQQEWLRGRWEEGRQVGVIIGTPAGGIWFFGVSWDSSFTAAELRKHLLPKPQIAQTILKHTLRQ